VLRKLPIGPKLIGLVSALLALMLGVATYSFFRSQALRDRVHGLSGELIPLVQALGVVHTSAMSQNLALERLLRRVASPRVSREELAEELRRFREMGRDVRSGLRDAKRQARDSAQRAKTRRDIEQLADVRAVLRVLQRDHHELTNLALEHLEAEVEAHGAERDASELRLSRFREQRLASEQRRFEQDMGTLMEDLEAFTARRAEGVRTQEEHLFELTVENLVLAILAFLFGVFVAALTTRRIVGPIRELVSGANRITDGDLDVHVDVATEDEVGELAEAFNQMVHELRSRERVKETFGKYLDPRIVENVIDEVSMQEHAGGERRVMTVFFLDVARFSGISERLTPSGLVKVINRYFTLVTQPISDHKGVVDKFIGDEVMAWWGPPFCGDDEHELLACRAALAQLDALERFRTELPELLGFRKGLPDIDMRIGVSTGDLVVGTIGSDRSKSYTVMGDTVNLASRLEGVNKVYGTRILISGATADAVREDLELREIDIVRVVGKEETTRLFEIMGNAGEVEALALELRDRFEEGLAAYREQRWDDALACFAECLEIDSEDGPSRTFTERIEALREDPPGEGWDGVWRLDRK
jgi:adenylate cyclase